jgi:hypothetical protein
MAEINCKLLKNHIILYILYIDNYTLIFYDAHTLTTAYDAVGEIKRFLVGGLL